MKLVLAVVLATFAFAPCAEAQRPEKVPRIGYLVLSPLSDPPSAERQAFLEGLGERGYVDGRNVIIEYRAANWNRELVSDLAEELVALKVDVIAAVPGTIEAARRATRTIPIVMLGGADPVEAGLVTSLARPGGNITGTAWSVSEMAGKQLALLKEALPSISRVAVFRDPATEGAQRRWQEMEAAARLLRVTIQSMDVRDPKDFPGAFSALTRTRPDALVTLLSTLTSAYRPIIVEFAAKQRLPTMFAQWADVEAGGLMSYSPSAADQFRRAATHVDRILKGARPGDLPIELPTKFELGINLKTAKALGITFPPAVLLRADKVIDQ